MALPKDVSKAVVRLDYTALPITEENNLAAWQTIRAELTRLTEIADAVDPLVVRLGEVTTRLEAADELLREAEGELRCACQSRKAARISQDIRVYLLSQDAEIARLQSGITKHVNSVCDLQSRLAAAYALLRECRRFAAWAGKHLPEALPVYEKLDAHLSENADVQP
jgi:hypothetical protein